jgi:hypothetical protein
MKKLSVMLCLIALLAFTLNGCGGSGTTDTSYYGGGDSGGTTTTAPTVTSCTTNLTPGQTCSITGTSFGSSRDSGQSTVSFVPQVTGGTTLTATTYLSWSDTAIQCITPSVVTGIQYVVVVNRYTSSGTLYSSTTGTSANMTTGTAATAAPAVASQSPNPATAGASVTLTGTNFPISYGYILVNGTVVSSTFTTTTATFTVPAGTATGATVTLGGGPGGSTTYSLVVGGGSTTPTITSISPNPVNAGSAITVNGTNLGTAGTFLIGTTAVTPTSWTATAITVTVPAATAVGATTVTVTPTGATAVTANLTIAGATTPLLTNINPSSGAAGTTVLLTGTNLGTAGTITFGSTSATATAWAATSITTTVPAGLTAGVVTVTVTPTGATAATISFTVSGTTTASWHTATAMDGNRDFGAPLEIRFDRRAANATEGLLLYNEDVDGVAGGELGLYCKRFTSAGWGTEARIGIADGTNNETLGRLDSDANGNAIATWYETIASGNYNWARRYNAATDSWNTAASIRPVQYWGHVLPAATASQVRYNSNNDAVLTYVTQPSVTTAAARQVYVRKIFGSNTDWAVSSPFDMTVAAAEAINLGDITRNCTGIILGTNSTRGTILAHFLYSDTASYVSTNYDVVTRVWDGRTWNATCWSTAARLALQQGVGGVAATGIATHRSAWDSTGNCFIVARDNGNNVFAVKYPSTNDWYGALGATPWNSPIQLNTAAATGTPVLAFDSSNSGLFVFQDNVAVRLLMRKYTGTSWVAGSFATAAFVDLSTGTASAAAPEIAVNSTGSFGLLVFNQNLTAGGPVRVLGNIYTTSAGSFGGAATIDANLSGNCGVPMVACGSTTGMAAFQGNSTVARVYTNSYY